MPATKTAPFPKRTITGYLNEKRKLVAQATASFLPAAEALVAALCLELRKDRPHAPDAVLVEMFLSDVGIDEETRATCLEIDRSFAQRVGLGLLDHALEVVGPDVVVTLRLKMVGPLHRLVVETLGEDLPLPLRVTMHSAREGLSEATLVDLDKLDLADLAPLSTTLAAYWKERHPDMTPAARAAIPPRSVVQSARNMRVSRGHQ